MNKSMCDGAGCPFQRQIEAVYEKVVTGNGEPPLQGRVKQLEVEMTAALPIIVEIRDYLAEQRGIIQANKENKLVDDKRAEEELDAKAKLVSEEKESRKERRRNRIAIAAILAVLVLPPASWVTAKAVQFFNTLYEITQEWHEIHKTEIQKPKIIATPAYPAYAHNRKDSETAIW